MKPCERKIRYPVTNGDERCFKHASITRKNAHARRLFEENRVDLITPDVEDKLFGYISGIVKNNDSRLIIANGTSNHVHLLISLGRTISISSLVGKIKPDCSTWIKTQNPKFSKFYWQDGYRAFSVSQSRVEDVMRYLENQKVHHKSKDFKTEFRGFLDKYEIKYDEKCMWD